MHDVFSQIGRSKTYLFSTLRLTSIISRILFGMIFIPLRCRIYYVFVWDSYGRNFLLNEITLISRH